MKNLLGLTKISVLLMIKQPPYLKKGDKIAIVCPGKYLPGPITKAIAILEKWGLEVLTGKTVSATYHQFAGDDGLRASDLQHFLDDEGVKAIIAGRGGYGTIRIIDALDFTAFAKAPKWLIGFSDITILLSHVLACYGIPSIHGQMPMTFDEATEESLESLRKALFGEQLHYTVNANSLNVRGRAEGILVGGNLTLLCAIEHSPSSADWEGKILFIEDVGEHEYAIDRMVRSLKRSGRLAGLKGLIVGAFNEIVPEKIYFGQTPEEVILEIVKEYNYPVCFGFPGGHIENNLAVVPGRPVTLTVGDNVTVDFGD